jgi:hypothetical protein
VVRGQFQANYGRPLLAARDAKCSAKEAEAGVLAMEALHKQVLPSFFLVLVQLGGTELMKLSFHATHGTVLQAYLCYNVVISALISLVLSCPCCKVVYAFCFSCYFASPSAVSSCLFAIWQ